MTGKEGTRIAVIGSGMAGLSCAAALRAAGLSPVVFEKSRGIGGRMATRRKDGLAFDHGAQYVTARGTAFSNFMRAATAAGHAAPWAAGDGWHVGLPGMSGLVRGLADGLDIRLAAEISAVRRAGGRWRVETGETGADFDIVACTAPAPQAMRLIDGAPEVAAQLARVRIAPCWALMVAFEGPLDGRPDVLRPGKGPVAWIARNGAKPARTSEGWVLHASPEWSARHLEIDRETARRRLLRLFAETAGPLPRITHAAAHRWRHALTLDPLGARFAASSDGTLLAGGDWALGRRVEAAHQSGLAMAAEVLGRQPS